jgi:PPP family 3-phenylpropionic acid transporter
MIDRHAPTATIGLVLTINAVMNILSQILWGIISDRIGSVKKVFMICLVFSMAGMLIMLQSRSIAALAVLIVVTTFFMAPLPSLMDSWTFQYVKNHKSLSYGSVRLWNSIGFAVTVFLMGKLKMITSMNYIMGSFLIFGTITVVAAYKISNPNHADDGLNIKRLTNIKDVGILFRNSRYVMILIIGGLVYVSITPISSYMPLLMTNAGGTDDLYGLAMAISALSEVPLFYFSSRLLAKFKASIMLCAAIFFYTLRLLLLSLAPSPAIIIMMQIMQALTYGLFLVSSIYYIDSLAPATHKASALLISTAVYSGTGAILWNYLVVTLINVTG